MSTPPTVQSHYSALKALLEKTTRLGASYVPAAADIFTSTKGLITPPPTNEHNSVFSQVYKNIFENGHGTWLWEPESEALYFDKPYMQMLGYTADEFPQNIQTWIELLHAEDKDSVLNTQLAIVQSPESGNSFENRFRMRMKNGEYRWIIGKGVVMFRNASGSALRVVGIHIDLVALDNTLHKHLMQYDRMHFALDAAKDGLWDWNSQSNGVYYSPRYLEMLGYTPENFPPVLESWASRVHPDDFISTVEMQVAVAKNAKHGDIFESIYRFLAADGSYKWLLGRGKVIRRDEDGIATRIVGLHTDITELRNTQEALANLVNTDPLTSLHSRFYLETETAKLRPAHHPISVIYCDVDCLKMVNDNMGHTVGDALLAKAAQLVRKSIRKTDIAARLGGDEFMILLVRCPEFAVKNVLSILRENIAQHNSKPEEIPVYMSLGSVTTSDHIPQHKLVAMADKEMMLDKSIHRAEHRKIMRSWIESQLKTTIDMTDDRL